ncbi:MAG: hypothetical protein GX601_04205, partial [Anaerolineales bacterium]|nr:hypothetical protein [Anaerolineales bacterium]
MIRAFRVTAETELAARAAQATAERLTERGLVAAADGFPLQFRLQAADAEAPISLAVTESGCVLAAREQVDFFTAAGVFLRRLRFLDGGAEAPVWIQAVTPRCAVRGAYFASHFHNWYITAPEAEQTRYLEDMALWGFNTLMAAFPMIDLLSGDCEEYHTQAARMVSLFRAAHELGMGVCTLPNVNSGYREFPKDWAGAPHADPLRRRGNSGNMLCPAKPGVQDWIDKDNHRFYRWLTECGVDMLITWPYDEGGCACPDCYPWGAKGFLRGSKRAFEMARNYFPNVKRILSTWMFDTPEEGEWDALTESLEEDRWCDMILADSHEDYPRYPLDKGVPGGLPLLNFPEISMWGLYPWGGWGA